MRGLHAAMAGTTAAAVLLALATAPVAAADGDDDPIAEFAITPAGPAAVPQGEPFEFQVSARNPGAEPRTVAFSIELRELEGAQQVRIAEHSLELDPDETETVAGATTPAQWFASTGQFELVLIPASGPILTANLEVSAPRVRVPLFRDVTAARGLDIGHRIGATCDGTLAAGAAWGDIDGDRDLDLFVPDQAGSSHLFINRNGSFADRAAGRGVAAPGAESHGAVMVDYDNDGDQDIYVTRASGDALYRNNGRGRFRDVATRAGIHDQGPGASASWGDYDGDGNLDLYIARWGGCMPGFDDWYHAYFDDTLYHADGDGTFTDVTALLRKTGPTDGRGFVASWLDYDDDGDLDLYLANDHVLLSPDPPFPKANVLWRNDGPRRPSRPRGEAWRFTNVSYPSSTGAKMNSMGVAIGDPDNDLDLDFAVSNMGPTALFRNEGDGTFEDVATEAGVARPEQRAGVMAITWGLDFADLNNDGAEDLYVAAGDMGAPTPELLQPNALFVNSGRGRFLDLSAPSGADDPGATRGVAFADFDRDGRVDLYLLNAGGRPHLFRNVTRMKRRGHWLEVDPVGRASNREGCGAKLYARFGRGPRMRVVSCGSTSLASGGDDAVHFGLGARRVVRGLRIEWPSGRVQRLRRVRADRAIRVREPRRPKHDRSRLLR